MFQSIRVVNMNTLSIENNEWFHIISLKQIFGDVSNILASVYSKAVAHYNVLKQTTPRRPDPKSSMFGNSIC